MVMEIKNSQFVLYCEHFHRRIKSRLVMHVLQINLDKKLYVFCNFPNFEKNI